MMGVGVMGVTRMGSAGRDGGRGEGGGKGKQ